MRQFLSCLCLGTTFFAGTLAAQSVVVPNANATTIGTSQSNSIVRNAGFPTTYQYGVNASQLTGVPINSVITGVSLRFMVFYNNPASWPPADISWTDYRIWVGPANPTATWVSNFNANFASAPVLVRTGPMTLDAGVFTNTNPAPPTPNQWAEFYFDFQTPYVYTGGDLAFLFSHPGSLDPNFARYPEVVLSDATTHGVARANTVFPPSTTSFPGTFYVMRIHYGQGTGCPGSSGTPPVLVQDGNTVTGVGGTIRLQIGNVPANSIVVFVAGSVQISLPIGTACTLLCSPDVLLPALADTKGRAVLPIAVPPAFLGTIFAQGAALDLGAPDGLTLTNAVSPASL